ncbi:MAG: sulfurtransferase complex subunit TusB [Pseudohongiellaceae bacterium]
MSSLHTCNRSPTNPVLQTCVSVLQPDDALLLTENGVYWATHDFLHALSSLPDEVTVLALHEDLQARGLLSRVSERIRIVDYNEFVRLCCEHDRVINWF